jgi:hypothetical protein
MMVTKMALVILTFLKPYLLRQLLNSIGNRKNQLEPYYLSIGLAIGATAHAVLQHW